MFWAAVAELSPCQLRSLLRALLPSTMEDTQRDRLLYGALCADHKLPECFNTPVIALHILPPTAVAMLSPEGSDIALFPERMALALPKYISLRTVVHQLLKIVEA